MPSTDRRSGERAPRDSEGSDAAANDAGDNDKTVTHRTRCSLGSIGSGVVGATSSWSPSSPSPSPPWWSSRRWMGRSRYVIGREIRCPPGDVERPRHRWGLGACMADAAGCARPARLATRPVRNTGPFNHLTAAAATAWDVLVLIRSAMYMVYTARSVRAAASCWPVFYGGGALTHALSKRSSTEYLYSYIMCCQCVHTCTSAHVLRTTCTMHVQYRLCSMYECTSTYRVPK